MNEQPESLFSFPDAAAQDQPLTVAGAAGAENPADDDLARRALEAAGEASYHWHIETDTLQWSANAKDVLGHAVASLSTGRQFATILNGENLTSRYDTVLRTSALDAGEGIAFQIEYQLKPDGLRDNLPTWIEDIGRWYGDAKGRPSEVYGIVRRIDERHQREQHLNFLSHNDPLTGMMNRSRMAEVLHEAIGVAANEGTSCAFVIAAVNNLDVVNEAYGYAVADEVIAALARRLRHVMRTGDAIARYSGGKFGIILNSCGPAELAIALERFLHAVRDSVIETSHGPVWALLSIGAVTVPTQATDVATATARAEEALCAAFRKPSDSYVIFESSEDIDTQRMLNARCATEIVECLKNGIFRLAFQPVVDARSGTVATHEALLRMDDSAGELITASHLVPVAERLGLIRLIDRAVVQLALGTLIRYPTARLSINMSAATTNDTRWHAQLIDVLTEAPELCRRLTVEITEKALAGDHSAAVSFIANLRQTGCTVAIDDFGSGFMSFQHLRKLAVDIIKLDGSYCRNLATDAENAYVVRTLVDMAHHFGVKTVAEWVETPEDAEILAKLGVDFLQGNSVGAPTTAAPWPEEEHQSFDFPDQPVAAPNPEEGPSDAALTSAIWPETAAPEPMKAAPPAADMATPDAEVSADVADVDDSLAKLRETLEQLNQYFGSRQTGADEARLAS